MSTQAVKDAVSAVLAARVKTMADQDKRVELRSPQELADAINLDRQMCDGGQDSFRMSPIEVNI